MPSKSTMRVHNGKQMRWKVETPAHMDTVNESFSPPRRRRTRPFPMEQAHQGGGILVGRLEKRSN